MKDFRQSNWQDAPEKLAEVTAQSDFILTVVSDDGAMRNIFAAPGDNLLTGAMVAMGLDVEFEAQTDVRFLQLRNVVVDPAIDQVKEIEAAVDITHGVATEIPRETKSRRQNAIGRVVHRGAIPVVHRRLDITVCLPSRASFGGI